MKEDKITSKGIISLLICSAAPLMRLLIMGYGLLTWVLIPVLILFAFNMKKLMKINAVQALVIIISGWLMFSSLYSPSISSISLESEKVQICTIILFLCMMNKKEMNILIFTSFLIASFFIYCYFFSSEFYLGGIRKYIYLQNNVRLDPNMVIMSFSVPILYSTLYLIRGNKKILKILIIVFIGLSLYGAFLGGSRGGLVGIAVGVFICIFREINLSAKRFAQIMGIIIIGALVFFFVRSYIPQELLNRMTFQSIQDSGGSGRFDMYNNYLHTFFDNKSVINILFGYGKESCKVILGKSAHNIVIDYLWDLGIVGLLFHFIVSYKVAKYIFKSGSNIAIASLVATMIWSLTISTSNQLLYWTLLYTSYAFASNRYSIEKLEVD